MTRYTKSQLARMQRNGGKYIPSEDEDLHALIKWLKLTHPAILYHHDYGADVFLSHAQAKDRSELAWGRGWPDLLIFEPRAQFVGLAIDLKREDVNLYNSKGFFKNDHIERQAEVLFQLRGRGWETDFVKGFEAARARIAGYLSIG